MMSKLSGSDEIPSNLRIIQKRTSKWSVGVPEDQNPPPHVIISELFKNVLKIMECALL